MRHGVCDDDDTLHRVVALRGCDRSKHVLRVRHRGRLHRVVNGQPCIWYGREPALVQRHVLEVRFARGWVALGGSESVVEPRAGAHEERAAG